MICVVALELTERLSDVFPLCPPLCVQLSVSSLFRGLDLQLLQPTSLSLLYSGTPLANDSTVTLDPMEISTYKLKIC